MSVDSDFLKLTLGLDVQSADANVDISAMLEKLHHQALTESLTGRVQKAAYTPTPYTPTTTITPAEGSPLAKSYAEFVSAPKPARVETEPCASGGTWIRHFDSAGQLYRVFLSPDDPEDEPAPVIPAKGAAIAYAAVPDDNLQKFLSTEG